MPRYLVRVRGTKKTFYVPTANDSSQAKRIVSRDTGINPKRLSAKASERGYGLKKMGVWERTQIPPFYIVGKGKRRKYYRHLLI